MRLLRTISLLWIICGYQNCFAQNVVVSGKIIAENNTPIIGAHVQLGSLIRVTDTNGVFSFGAVAPGEYLLQISALGFKKYQKNLTLPAGAQTPITLKMQEVATTLNEVTVRGTSAAATLRNSTANVSLLEARGYAFRSTQTTDLLNTLPGVQVRQSGGVGNAVDVSLHGLSGRQVKFFLDGVPLDFLLPVEELGMGMAMSLLPVHQMERMEVYKGAVPVSLGADALGGAIQFVTRNQVQDYLEVSSQHSSFHTWQHSFGAQKVFESGFIANLSGFYTASENNYRLDSVTVINDFGNPEPISTTKFHDAFRGRLIKGQIGWVGKPWAERLLLSASYGDVYDEIQHNFEMRQPYGQAINMATTYNVGLHYEQYNIANHWDLRGYLGYNRILTEFVDTTRNIYDWRGEVLGKKTYGGEITTTQSHLQLQGNNLALRLGATYHITPQSRLEINAIAAGFVRSGTDTVQANVLGEDFYTDPVRQTKTVVGAGYTHEFWEGSLVSTTALKGYHYAAEGFLIEDGKAVSSEQERMQPGFMQSVRWQISPTWRIKASYEYATRMPDRLETMGDFSAAINANPKLRPETSHNINLGSQYQSSIWQWELNGFFRSVNDIIILQAVPPPVLSTFENLLKARVLGIEGEIRVKPLPCLTAKVNATYQDIRNRSDKANDGVSSNRYFDVRLPNRPYLFGNGEINFQKKGLFGPHDGWQAWWNTAYVAGFFRYWEIDGRREDKLTVPDQWIHSLGMAYTFWQERLTLSVESQNIFDTAAYDNFRVQKPGRSWHAKIRLFIAK